MSEGERLTGSRLFWAAMTLSTANFMVVLDTTIANVSIPHIAGSLGVSANQATWTITSYAVADAITVVLSGWLAQRFGGVRTFTFCLIGFTLF
ncbi:MAG: MFS transporter, partial [Sphingobacteriales bacterium]